MNNRTIDNPILPGFYPDPSICRVGEDYYLINSSFTFFPGIPIFKSKDLVNWNQIGHVLDRPSQLNLDGAAYTGGIFAPTIRYHKETFYVITTNVDNGGNFIVTAKNPEGPWSEPYWLDDAPGIDPSLFFDDDGRAYYIGTRGKKEPRYFGDQEIWLQELDLNTMKLIGESYPLWDGALKNAFFPEGPHLYKVNGYYYLMIAEGGTEHYHSVTIARSKNVFGPYEGNPGNPILTHRHLGKGYAISNPGHADIVETQNGQWYMVALASRPYGGYHKNLCRETFLMPVAWEDGWPIVSPGTGRIEFTYQAPSLPEYTVNERENRDDFNKNELDLVWNFYHTPREKFWSLAERPGHLRLKLRPQGLVETLKMPPYDAKYERKKETILDCPSFVGRRQQHMNFNACTKMEFNPQSENEAAGLALIQNNNHQFRLEYTIENGERIIRLIKHISKVDLDFAAKTFNYENIEEKLAQKAFESKVIYLKVCARGQDYSFYCGDSLYSMEPLIENVNGRILSPDMAGGCSGTYIGMFASSNGKLSKSAADFDYFEYKEV